MYYSSNLYPTLPPFGHNYHYNALAESCAAETRILAEEAVRREEELLQLRLGQLRQSRLYQPNTYASIYPGTSVPRPYDNRLELLRRQVEEEERLLMLGALHRRQKALEDLERSRLSTARRREEEEIELLRRERAGRQHEYQLAVEEQRWRQRLAESPPLFTTEAADVRHCMVSPQHPKEGLVELVVQLPFDGSQPASLPARQVETLRRSSPQESNKEQQRISQAVDLFQQLGLFAPASNARKEPRKDEQHVCPGRTEMSKMKTEVALKASTSNTTETPLNPSKASIQVVDFRQLLDSLVHVDKEENKVPSSAVSQSKPVQATLKEQLEKRLNNEHANEVRDTIQALLASLEDNSATARPASKPQESNVATTTSSKSSPSVKGKSKEAPAAELEPKLPSSGDIEETMTRILSIENRFYALENEFVLPKRFEFVTSPSTDSTSAISRLTYTASNQPVRFYEQSLSHLLTQLDSIESHGNNELRKKRKEVVSRVEQALEELEQEVEGRWSAMSREAPSERLATPVPLSAPTEGDKTESSDPVPVPVPSQPTGGTLHLRETHIEETLKEPLHVDPAAVVLTRIQEERAPETEGPISNEPTSTSEEAGADEESSSPTPALGEPTVSAIPLVRESQPKGHQLEPAEGGASEETLVNEAGLAQTPQPAPAYPPEPQAFSPASQTDLSATIRPSAPNAALLVGNSTGPPVSGFESESVAEGFLLENETSKGDVLSKHEDIDADSTVSDWSEVDAPSQ